MMEQREQIYQLIDDMERGEYSTEFLHDNNLSITSSTSNVCVIVQYDELKSEYDDSFRHEFGVHTVMVRNTQYEMLSFHLEDKDGGEVMATKDQRMQLGLQIKQVLIDLETTE